MPPEWEKLEMWTFSPLLSGPVLKHFLWKIRKNFFGLSFLLVPFPELYFHDFWSILGVFFKHLWRLWANGGYSGFCNISYIKPYIWRVRGFNSWVILGDFSRTPSWTAFSLVFCVFRGHFWLTFDAERGSGSDFGGKENLDEKREWKEFGKNWKWGGGAL